MLQFFVLLSVSLQGPSVLPSDPGGFSPSLQKTSQRSLVPTGIVWQICASNCDFDSLESAIASASPGDTLEIASGTYQTAARVVIDKDLIIRGAGITKTTLVPSVNTGSSGDDRA